VDNKELVDLYWDIGIILCKERPLQDSELAEQYFIQIRALNKVFGKYLMRKLGKFH